MKRIPFFKYHGTGNDFILIDNRTENLKLTGEQIIHLCNRRFGIGSDGLILIENNTEVDFYINFYNPDASQSFCGNGSRCAVMFAKKLGVSGRRGRFSAIDGIHHFEIDDELVRIHMNDVKDALNEGNNYIIHTGSPHFIVYTKGIDSLDVVEEGRKIRYSERFQKDGINVNFVEEYSDKINIRTYERGVEGETLSCGTGVTAAALSFALRHPESKQLKIIAKGGELQVSWDRDPEGMFRNIYLSGPAVFVYEGFITL